MASKNIYLLLITFLIFINISCDQKENYSENKFPKTGIKCDDLGCYGKYSGPEFVDGSDVAHQFSNSMCRAVGDKLKELYYSEKYNIVDFSRIRMETKGMGSGQVDFKLFIPFSRVKDRCEAFTSFDHVGGWNHKPAIDRRIKELENVLMEGHKLRISKIKKTSEGLQEYWIQWKNKVVQSNCK